MFKEDIRKIREEKGWTQSDLAVRVGISQANLSKYESGKVYIPLDVAVGIIRALGSKRLAAKFINENHLDIINIELLNNVDDSINTILDVLIEEMEESIDACKDMKKLLRNKTIDDLDDQSEEWLYELVIQLADLKPAVDLYFIRIEELFDIDLEKVEKTTRMKLKSKKYLV